MLAAFARRVLAAVLCSIALSAVDGLVTIATSAAQSEPQACTSGAECPSGTDCCFGRCYDVTSDSVNCGACGVVCAEAETCVAGHCVCHRADNTLDRCTDSEICCSGSPAGCVDAQNDFENCGACNAECGPGEHCGTGVCRCGSQSATRNTVTLASDPVCADGEACCGAPGECKSASECECGPTDCVSGQECCSLGGVDRCTNAALDPYNCGSCANVCEVNQRCLGSSCLLLCPAGLTACGDRCVDLASDDEHCGSCGTDCGSGTSCNGTGKCVSSCAPGMTACGSGCVELTTSSEHCGACNNPCPSGERCDGRGSCEITCHLGLTRCADGCRDLNADTENCGSCDNPCASGERCDGSGACTASCRVGTTACIDGCKDLNSDSENCGACGNACSGGERCDGSGSCERSCLAGESLCAGDCADLTRAFDHCGACGVACSAGEVCDGGRCVLDCQAELTDCSGRCVDLDTDESHCGACGSTCATGERCEGSGSCALSCQSDLTDCSGVCADTDTDRANCGACGTGCLSNEICNTGVCEPAAFDMLAEAADHYLPYWSTDRSRSVILLRSDVTVFADVFLYDDQGGLLGSDSVRVDPGIVETVDVGSLGAPSDAVGAAVVSIPTPRFGAPADRAEIAANLIVQSRRRSDSFYVPSVNAQDGVWTGFASDWSGRMGSGGLDSLFLFCPEGDLALRLTSIGVPSRMPLDGFPTEVEVELFDRGGSRLLLVPDHRCDAVTIIRLRDLLGPAAEAAGVEPYEGPGSVHVRPFLESVPTPTGPGRSRRQEVAYLAFQLVFEGGGRGGTVGTYMTSADPVPPTVGPR